MIPILALAMTGWTGCSKSNSTEKGADVQPPKAANKMDETYLFPLAGRVATQYYADHMMNKEFLPGGTMAEYNGETGEFRAFIVHLAHGGNASFLLEDYKKALHNPTPAANGSAYFGTDDGQPTYVFVRGPYLAGIVGLPRDRAATFAKELSDKLS